MLPLHLALAAASTYIAANECAPAHAIKLHSSWSELAHISHREQELQLSRQMLAHPDALIHPGDLVPSQT